MSKSCGKSVANESNFYFILLCISFSANKIENVPEYFDRYTRKASNNEDTSRRDEVTATKEEEGFLPNLLHVCKTKQVFETEICNLLYAISNKLDAV